MATTAIYPGTFDPLTLGHAELANRAAGMFDRLVVAVAASPAKAPLFDLDERVELARQAFAGNDRIAVAGFDGLLVECARRHGARVILRGLRAVSDFEYEYQMAAMNRRLAPGIETVFLTPDERYAFISASLVREVARLGGDVSAFVPPVVLAALRQRLG